MAAKESDSNMRLFGEALRRLRRDRNFSLAELADSIGCSIVHLSEIERGRKNPPSPPKIQTLLARLDHEEKLQEMLLLAAKSRRSIEITVNGKNDDVANMLVALARRCDEGSLDDETARRIRSLLERD